MPERKEASKPTGRRRLGRGLTSLVSTPVPVAEPVERPPAATAHGREKTDDDAGIRLVDIDRIRPNPSQPRQHFDERSLETLAASITAAGLMQPIVVRVDTGGGFQLVVGERRWRAARKAGLTRIPAVVREIDDQASAEWALIENIQREDLNPLERAEGFLRLIEEFGLTHQQVGERVGLDRSTITNLLRLLELDEQCRDAVRAGRLGQAQARELLAISNIKLRQEVAGMAMRKEWSVRTLKSRVKSLLGAPAAGAAGRRRSAPTASAPHRADLERRLSDHLGTKVQIRPGRRKGTGQLLIDFFTLDQFEGLMQRLGFKAE